MDYVWNDSMEFDAPQQYLRKMYGMERVVIMIIT